MEAQPAMVLPAPTSTFRDRRSWPLIPWLCLTPHVQPQVPWSFPGLPALCRVVSPSTLPRAVSLTSCPARSGPALLPPVRAHGAARGSHDLCCSEWGAASPLHAPHSLAPFSQTLCLAGSPWPGRLPPALRPPCPQDPHRGPCAVNTGGASDTCGWVSPGPSL